MPLRIVQVDAFTDRPFAGNPAAVCVLPEPRNDSWMQAVAREMNLSETAFLIAEAAGYHLRWFTPTVEVDLWEAGDLPAEAPAIFRTRSGELVATRSAGWITLDFPRMPVESEVELEPLENALGVPVVTAGMSRFDVLAEVESAALVRELIPNFGRIETIPARGIIVTARSDLPDHDFVSRFFGPRCGVPEDPVTGSAHCTLGPYWSGKLGKRKLVGYQASSRGGVVRVALEGDRVLLGGQAVTVLRGELVEGA